MKHDAKLAHQSLSNPCLSRDVDMFRWCCPSGVGGVRVYASEPPIIKVSAAFCFLRGGAIGCGSILFEFVPILGQETIWEGGET